MKKTLSRESTAYRMAIRRYVHQINKHKMYAYPGLILPGIGNILVLYVPPLIIAKIIRNFQGKTFSLREIAPYIIAFGLFWMLGEILWRVAFLCLNRSDTRGMADLYKDAVAELL